MDTEKEPITLHATLVQGRFRPFGIARMADDLFNMAHQYTAGEGRPLAQYYVYCVSIELSFKSAILAHDCSADKIAQLKKLSHDLGEVHKCFAEIHGPILDEQDLEAIQRINPLFRSKSLEYFNEQMLESVLRGFREFPDIREVASAAQKLNAFIHKHRLFVEL